MNEFYQSAKPVIIKVLSLSKDAVHIHVGFLAFVLAYLLIPKWRESWKILLIPFGLSLGMELLDAIADYHRLGRFLPFAYVHDLLNTNFIPVISFFVLKYCRKKPSS